MSDHKSPFYVIEDFLSPLTCELIVDNCNFFVPDKDKDGFNIKTLKSNEESESIVYERLRNQIIPIIQDYYDCKYKGTESITFEWYPIGSNSAPVSGNSTNIKGKWVRTNTRDFTGVIFLSDYQDQPPIDGEFEVYGGKLEFVQHQFGFNPKRGTLVIFPSDPHFLNNTSSVMVGNLFQVRFHISAQQPWIYRPQQFPGNYTLWFNQ